MAHISRTLRTVLTRFRSAAGAIDLASILVGVLVMGVLGSIIAASVFTVIPWSQDAAAKSSLDAVGVAQGVSKVKDGTYRDWAGLTAAKLLTGLSTNMDTVVNAAGDCYVSAAKSGSGTSFYRTSRDNTIMDDKVGLPDTDWCVSSTRALADPVVNLYPNPSFETGASPTVTRTNYYPNPLNANPVGGLHAGASAYTLGAPTAAFNAASGWQSITSATPLPAGSRAGYFMNLPISGVAGDKITFNVDFQGRTGPGNVAMYADAESGTTIYGHYNTISSAASGSMTGTMTLTGAVTFLLFYIWLENPTGTAYGSNSSVQVGHVEIEKAATVGPLVTGALPATIDYSYAWSGAANASASTESARSITGAGLGASIVSQTHAWASSGSQSMRITTDYPTTWSAYAELDSNLIVPGKTYTALVKRKLFTPQAAAFASLMVTTRDGSGPYVNSVSTGPNVVGTTELRTTFTVSPAATERYLRLYNGGARGDVDVLYDDFMLVEVPDLAHPYTGPYFDGSSANGVWNGAANASSSTGWVRR